MNTILKTVEVRCVQPDPDQPRKQFDDDKLAELADSILSRGLLQPITVRLVSGKPVQYRIVTGERRWRAHCLAGLRKITVNVVSAKVGSFLDQIVENDQRDAMTPLDRAKAYRKALDEGLANSPADLAVKLGLRQTFRVVEVLSLLKLCPEAQQLLDQDRISRSSAWQLTVLSHDQQRTVLARHATGQLTSEGLFAAACQSARCPVAPVDAPSLFDRKARSRAVKGLLSTVQRCGSELSELLSADDLQGIEVDDARTAEDQLRMLQKTVRDLQKLVSRSAAF